MPNRPGVGGGGPRIASDRAECLVCLCHAAPLENRVYIQSAELFFVTLNDGAPCEATRRGGQRFALLDVLNRPGPRT